MKFKVWAAMCKWSTVHMVMMHLTHFCATEIYAHDICLVGRRFTFGNNTSELYNSCGNPTSYLYVQRNWRVFIHQQRGAKEK